MPCLAQVQRPAVGDYGHPGDIIEGGPRLCHQEVQLAEECGSGDEFGQIGLQEKGELVQYAGYFLLLFDVQFGYVVFQFEYLGGLDEGGLAAR